MTVLIIYLIRASIYLAAALIAYKHRNYWVAVLGVWAFCVGSANYFIGSREVTGSMASILALLILMTSLKTTKK